MAITHTTPADGTFSSAGTTAWNADHTGNCEVVASDAPNQDFDLTTAGGGGAVTIISESITGITARDQIILEAWVTTLNNSGGATIVYTHTFSLGTVSVTAVGTVGQAAHASNRASRKFSACAAVTSSSSASAQVAEVGGNPSAANGAANLGGQFSCQGWNTSGNDATGTQTLIWTVTPSAASGTQTLTLHSYTIRKISTL